MILLNETMRFIWRARHHLSKPENLETEIPNANREMCDRLLISLTCITDKFGELGEKELRTTALDVVRVWRVGE